MAKKAVLTVPREIVELVDKFAEHRDSYRRDDYKEAVLRNDFLDPFFEALGWDVNNRRGFAEAYRDVILEQSLRVERSVKAPDYCFRIGGTAKFFVEAKRPAVDVKSDVGPAFQLRRYAWTAKLPLSILTDFEELAVYDCRVKPDKDDKASTARVMLVSYAEYMERWEEIASVFSRDAVWRGSFDKFAESTKKKRGTAEVDEAFLAEIESWRESLAKNLSARNAALSDRELNSAVQLIIDRVIFLRMCEGRAIEDCGRLQSLLNGEQVYPRLVEMFHRADEKYNSGLFHFQKEKGRENPDTLTPSLAIDDKVLKDIVRRLYYPESPYEFAAMPAEILGQVYEQFLGKVIRLTAGHRAKVEEKPEVRKAGGVYYTPTYIVDYIVQNTVGKLLEGKSVQKVGGLTATFKPSKKGRPLAVLDPACGSGSFLIGAYQYLLDWYLKQYTQVDNPAKHSRGASPRIYQSPTGDWRLTIAERKRILLAHIYGVDIDYQACEVTKLSLLLKALEGATRESVERLLFHKERALPDLAGNIKCGNSLIGPDFYAGRQRDLFDEDEVLRINAFDWKKEFLGIFAGKNPGFDAVIGNPPYIRIQRIGHDQSDYLFSRYKTPASKTDLSQLFVERSLQLANDTGRVGFICTSQWIATDYGEKMRALLSHGFIEELIDFGSLPVFTKVSTYPAIMILTNEAHATFGYRRIRSREELGLDGVRTAPVRQVRCGDLGSSSWNLGALNLLNVLANRHVEWVPLKSLAQPHIGALTGMDSVFVMLREEAEDRGLEEELLFPYAYRGAEVARYADTTPQSVVIYPYREGGSGDPLLLDEDELKGKYPRIYDHLSDHKPELRERRDSRKFYAKGASWYRHLRPGSFDYIHPRKLIIKGIDRCSVVGRLRPETIFNGANCPGIVIKDEFRDSEFCLLAVLNSSVATFYLRSICPPKLNDYRRFNAHSVAQVPIPAAAASRAASDETVRNLSDMSARMIELVSRCASARTEHHRNVLERRIEATDREIDQLVYELYGLTDREIALVEEATAK